MECPHSWKAGGKCEICGTRQGWRDRSSAREEGDAKDVTTGNSEHGESQPRMKRPAASAAVQAIVKRETSAKLDLHQTEEEKTTTKPRKKRRRKPR